MNETRERYKMLNSRARVLFRRFSRARTTSRARVSQNSPRIRDRARKRYFFPTVRASSRRALRRLKFFPAVKEISSLLKGRIVYIYITDIRHHQTSELGIHRRPAMTSPGMESDVVRTTRHAASRRTSGYMAGGVRHDRDEFELGIHVLDGVVVHACMTSG